ncbi:MAG: hypothetical protein EBZ77_03195, partial [Chitinophagia bacterium]|nr:hypothetical protein [Chitinophagia bacterium]
MLISRTGKVVSLSLVLFCISFALHGQDTALIRRYLLLDSYLQDTSATALILLEKGTVNITN